MMRTESEARACLCPQSMHNQAPATRCEASLCMAWRWQMVSANLDHPFEDEKKRGTKGYCGLARRP